MILGIASLGEGRSSVQRRVAVWGAHMLGGITGGGVTAAVVWLLASPLRSLLPRPSADVLFLSVCAVAVATDLRLLALRKPGCQVPATWLRRYGAVRSYWLYGVRLGAGLLTHMPYSVIYVVFAAIGLLISSPGHAMLIGAAFAGARTFVIGPGSIAPTISSVVMYRSSSTRRLLPVLSAISVIAMAAFAIGGST